MTHAYSVRTIHETLRKTFHQYLRAQYHIWDESLIHERDRILEDAGNTHQAPRLEATPQYAAGRPYCELPIPSEGHSILTAASEVARTGIPRIPYAHQYDAIEAFVRREKNLIVATGTGSGKTESFLMPILASLSIEATRRPESWRNRGVRALLLYPMNALVNDQLARLRRLFGDEDVQNKLRGEGSRVATFGMYTSRTPYAGQRTSAKDRDRVLAELKKLYFADMTESYRTKLYSEGKWPAKDLEAFVANGLNSSPDDAELMTRHEMQTACPDLLVTNYSMLEYMMLRPLEAPIFEQTREWLHSSSDNYLTVVLDEAHMYRGSGGAEVAYLLRRLQSRLQVPRSKLRFILTSASLGSSNAAQKEIIEFAEKLTGANAGDFELVRSTLEPRPLGAVADSGTQHCLASFEYSTLGTASVDAHGAKASLEKLASQLHLNLAPPEPSPAELQHFADKILKHLPVADLVSNALTSEPCTLSSIAAKAFPHPKGRDDAAEALLALMAFGKKR